MEARAVMLVLALLLPPLTAGAQTPPAVSLLGATGVEPRLSLMITDEVLDAELILLRNAAAVAQRGLRLQGWLAGPTNHVIPLEFLTQDGKAVPERTLDLPPATGERLRIRAILPRPGEYRGLLLATTADGGQRDLLLTVTRDAPAPGRLRVEPLLPQALLVGDALRLPLSLTETEGRAVGAEVLLWDLRLRSGTNVRGVPPAAPDGKRQTRILASVEIEPRMRVALVLGVPGFLDASGTYVGKLQVQTRRGEAQEVEFEATARRHFLVATLLLVVGIVAGWGLTAFLSGGHGRLQQREQLLTLREQTAVLIRDLPASLADPDRQVANHLAAAIETALLRAAVEEPQDVVATLRERLSLLVRLVAERRAVTAVSPAQAAPLLEELDALAQSLAADSPSATALSKAHAALAGMPSKRLRAETEAVQAAVTAARDGLAALGNVDLPADLRAQVDSAMVELQAIPATARTAPALAATRTVLAEALGALLEARLRGTPALGFQQPAWVALIARCNEIRAQPASLGSAPAELVLRALATWLSEAAFQLGKALEALAPSAGAAELEAARAKLADTRKAQLQGNLAGALAAYDEAHAQALRLAPPPVAIPRLGPRAAAAGAASAAEPPLADIPPQVVLGATTPATVGAMPAVVRDLVAQLLVGQPGSAAATAKRRNMLGHVALIAIALLTTCAGLGTLYLPNPTWGSETDLLVALGWGAGLQFGASITASAVLTTLTR